VQFAVSLPGKEPELDGELRFVTVQAGSSYAGLDAVMFG